MDVIPYRKIEVHRFGGPAELQLVNAEIAPPPKGFARLKSLAIGVGYTDVVAREGEYVLSHKLPLTPGYELVGEVVDYSEDGAAARPDWIQPGARAAACLTHMDGYREYASLPFHLLVPLPADLDTYVAAALPLNYLTALSLLERHGRVKPGQSILIHGASGGVGEAVCQLGRLQQLKMYGTASARNAARLEPYSVTLIDYHTQDFEAVVRQLQPGGLHAVFDSVGGRYLIKSFRCLQRGGVLVSYAFMGRRGKIYQDTLTGALRNMFLRANLQGRRTALCSVPNEIRGDPAWYRNSLARLLQMAAENKIAPTLGAIFSLEDVATAHRSMERRELPGKILLVAG